MNLPHAGEQRRSALFRVSALIGIAISVSIETRQHPAAGPIATMSNDPLLIEASEYLAGIFEQRGAVIVGPISLLQCHFSLGYGRAIALAVNLEKSKVWAIFHDRAGMRSARRCSENGGGKK